jgi:anti-sigma factor RsiW
MQCADLERYLEAYLDGRLGRSRSLLLRRHLGICPACEARIEKLRQFERDINRRLHIMERAQSLWSELEPEPARRSLTALPTAAAGLRLLPAPPRTGPTRPGGPVRAARAARPPRRPARARRLLTRILGALMIAGAAGAVVQLVRPYLGGPATSDPVVLGYLDFVGGDDALELRTSKPASLRDWFTMRLSKDFPPLPDPDGFVMTGGRLDYLAGEPTALVAYRHDATPALLYVQPAAGRTAVPDDKPSYADVGGVTRLSWQHQAFAFDLVSSLPPTDIGSFAEPGRALP